MDSEKKKSFPANNATSDFKGQSDRSSIRFCLHLLIQPPNPKKANTEKEMLFFNYQGKSLDCASSLV